jgi:hypothetical protein
VLGIKLPLPLPFNYLLPKVKLPQTIFAGIFIVITMVGPTKVSIIKLKIEMHCAKQIVAT